MAASFDGLRFSHWHTELRSDGILVLSLDRQGAPVNALSQDVLIELADVLDIDPIAAAREKIVKNAAKYPPPL